MPVYGGGWPGTSSMVWIRTLIVSSGCPTSTWAAAQVSLVSSTARGLTMGGPAHAAAAAGARPHSSRRARTRHAPPTPPHRNDLSADGCLGVTSDILSLRTPTARQRGTAPRHHAQTPARSLARPPALTKMQTSVRACVRACVRSGCRCAWVYTEADKENC